MCHIAQTLLTSLFLYFSMETFIMLLFMALAHCVNIILELFFCKHGNEKVACK